MRTGTRSREADPGEDRVDVGQSLRAACGVRHADAARYAGHVSEDGLGVSHQLRFDAIADADPRQLGLLEVPVDPIAVGVDDRDIGAPSWAKSPTRIKRFVT